MPKVEANAEEIAANLAQFTGTMGYLRWNPVLFPKVVLTDGAAYVAEAAGAYWLMDLIASYQPQLSADPMTAYMQFWTLKVKDGAAVAICERDTDDEVLRQEIPMTDFPLEEVKFYVSLADEDGTMVIMLPSEH